MILPGSSSTSKSLGSVEEKKRRENKHDKIVKEKKTDRTQNETQQALKSKHHPTKEIVHEVEKTGKTKDVIQKSKLFHCL